MPFQSEKQRRYLWANEPEIARDWTDTYGSRIKKDDGGIMRLNYIHGGITHPDGRRGFPGGSQRGPDYQGMQTSGGTLSSGANYGGQGSHHPDVNTYVQPKVKINPPPPGVTRPKQTIKAQKKAVKKRKIAKYKEKTSNFLQNQLKARTDQAYNLSMMLPWQKARSLANAKDFLNYRKNQGDDVSEFEEIFTMDPKNWNAEQFNKIMSLQGNVEDLPPQPHRDKMMDYTNFLLVDKQLPGLSQSGDVGNVYRMKNPKGAINPDTGQPFSNLEWDKFRDEMVRDRGYETGREGPVWRQQGYSSEADYLTSTRGGGGTGGGGATTPTTDTPSAFQQSLTTGASSPFDYYVGQDPTAANLAWGEKFNVDPRTMYKTSWADGGRIPAAYGGIMDTDTGRRAYGFGSFFKSVKNAAKKVFKSPIGKAALIAGAGYLTGPTQMGLWGKGAPSFMGGLKNLWLGKQNIGGMVGGKPVPWGTRSGGLWNWVKKNPWKTGIGALTALPFFMGGGDDDKDKGFDYEGAENAYRNELMRIKAGAMAGTLDRNKFNYLPSYKEGGRIGLQGGGDPLLRDEYDKYVFEMEEMGIKPMTFEEFLAEARSGMYAGGQSTPSDYTMEDAMMTTTQDKLGGITDVMKQADLNRQGSVGQYYAADGGRIGYAGGSGKPPITLGQNIQAPGRTPPPPQRPNPMPAPQPNRMGGMPGGMNPMMGGMHPMMNRPMMNRPMMNRPMMNRPMMNPMGGRRMAQEGGLMDLGGMEKDYRQEGGFVPLGGKEKADDVPARLSKNEFVFTADAVRGAGGGDIDKGAEVMENIMKNLEEGGQISEETQGLSGAQEMFGVSERLSEVV